jgi:hypothetical protein
MYAYTPHSIARQIVTTDSGGFANWSNATVSQTSFTLRQTPSVNSSTFL